MGFPGIGEYQMELIHKYMQSEEQEIIDLLLSVDSDRTDLVDEDISMKKSIKRGMGRIADTRTCSKISDVGHRYDCMIKVYQKYISSMSADVSRASTEKQRGDLKDKIAKAKERIAKWTEAKTAATHSQKISRLGGKSKSVGVKTAKQKAKEASKTAKKGSFGGFKI